MKKIDVQVENHGTIFLFCLLTTKAKTWVKDNVDAESHNWLGHNLAVEHHYAQDLVEGMINDGLSVA